MTKKVGSLLNFVHLFLTPLVNEIDLTLKRSDPSNEVLSYVTSKSIRSVSYLRNNKTVSISLLSDNIAAHFPSDKFSVCLIAGIECNLFD